MSNNRTRKFISRRMLSKCTPMKPAGFGIRLKSSRFSNKIEETLHRCFDSFDEGSATAGLREQIHSEVKLIATIFPVWSAYSNRHIDSNDLDKSFKFCSSLARTTVIILCRVSCIMRKDCFVNWVLWFDLPTKSATHLHWFSHFRIIFGQTVLFYERSKFFNKNG